MQIGKKYWIMGEEEEVFVKIIDIYSNGYVEVKIYVVEGRKIEDIRCKIRLPGEYIGEELPCGYEMIIQL